MEVNSGNTINLIPDGSQSGIPLDINGIPDLGAGNGVGGFTFDLNWDTNVIYVDIVTAATIGGFPITAGTPNNTTGEVTITGFSFGSYLTENTTVATLEISAKGDPGDTISIDASTTSLGDKNAQPIAATPVNAPVQILDGQTTYTLTIAVDGSGSTTPTAGTHDYPEGTVMDISATPDAHWYFVNWSGHVSDPNSTTNTITMNTDKTVIANLTAIVKTKEPPPNLNSRQNDNPRAKESDSSSYTLLPLPTAPTISPINWPMLWIIAGAVVVVVLIFLLVKRRML